jgi:hypothetical protein
MGGDKMNKFKNVNLEQSYNRSIHKILNLPNGILIKDIHMNETQHGLFANSSMEFVPGVNYDFDKEEFEEII